MANERFCKDCTNHTDDKPMPRCRASRYPDLVTGDSTRTCFIERLDGIGRCGSMGNNFTLTVPAEKKKPGPKPKDA